MDIILYGHAGSMNHGCEAIVRGTVKLLPATPDLYTDNILADQLYQLDNLVRLLPTVNKTLQRCSFEYILSSLQIKLFHKTRINTYYRTKSFVEIANSNCVFLSVGGDTYCYGGIEEKADLNVLLHHKGAKTILWGCSIDPEAITPEMVKDLRRYDLITVREPLTQAALAAAGITANVRSVADPAFLLDVEKTSLPDGFLAGNTIGLNLSPLILHYTEKKEEALAGFQALVQHILDTTDSAIALIPHVVKSKSNDLEVLEPLFRQFKDTGRVLLIPDQNCMRLKYIISQCRLFIGARTHATIAAYSTCVPTLVIGYSVKSRGIATDLFGTEENYVVPIQTIKSDTELISAFDWLEANATAIKLHLQSVIPAYQEKARMGRIYLDELTKQISER